MYSGGYIILENKAIIESISQGGTVPLNIDGIFNTIEKIYNSNKPCIISASDAALGNIRGNIFMIVTAIGKEERSSDIIYVVNAIGSGLVLTLATSSDEPDNVVVSYA